MVDADQPAIQFQKTIALAELLPGKAIGVPVDDRQNRLNIARSPGDSLKVNFEREHLVFWQGEEFTVDVQPHLTNLKNRSARCKVSIVPARISGPAVWTNELEFELDSDGSSPSQQLRFEMPVEGVYDLVMQLENRGVAGVPLPGQKTISRRLQFVSLSEEPPTSNGEIWREQSLIDPASPRTLVGFQWSRLLKNAGLKQVANSHSKRSVVTHSNQKLVELGPGGWQAISLRANRNGDPLLIQVEYAAEEDIQMGLSILQPNRNCLLYTSPSPRDQRGSRMPSSA